MASTTDLSFTVLNGRATFIEAINASAQNLPAVQGSLVVNDADIGNTLDAKIVGTPTLTYSGGAASGGQQPVGLDQPERVEVDGRRLERRNTQPRLDLRSDRGQPGLPASG